MSPPRPSTPSNHLPVSPPRTITGRLVLATHNQGKVRELIELLRSYRVQPIAAGELGLEEPEETGTSFRSNARLKAVAASASGLPAIADDSGLSVAALGGEPGIHSARWAGKEKDFGRAMQIVEDKLRAFGATQPAQRRADFVCALCLAWPDGHVEEFEGIVRGTVVWPPRGGYGFGYDPMFLPHAYSRTFGEMSAEEKHALPPAGTGLSHRARAFLKLAEACLEKR